MFRSPFPSAAYTFALTFFISQALTPVPARAAESWPGWRGPHGDGKVPEEKPPLQWGAESGILWKTPVPGRGHSSPTIHGKRIFLATADEAAESQSVLAFDQETGKRLWEKVLFTHGFDARAHKRNTQASCSIACAV